IRFGAWFIQRTDGKTDPPTVEKRDRYDFSSIDQCLEYLLGKGMNAFIMGTAPNLKRQGKNEFTPEFITKFTETLKAYGDHLREKGWIDKAYVYTYDEAPKRHWGEVRKIAKAIKRAAPELRILQQGVILGSGLDL
ncbi:MAG: hypothetical protein ACC628_27455, partial [Pirellulaceae bacterium]